MASIFSPGPIKDWKPDPISITVLSDDVVSLDKSVETSYTSLQEKLSPVLEQERAILEIVDSLPKDIISKDYDRSTFSVNNPTYNQDIKSTLLGFIYTYSQGIRVNNSLWSKLPVLLGFRLQSTYILNQLIDLYKNYSNRVFSSSPKTGAIPELKKSVLEISAEELLVNLPYEFFKTIPVEVYEYITDLYKALFLLLDEINKERYSEDKSDVYDYIVSVSQSLIETYEYISMDFMSCVNYDQVQITNLIETLNTLDDIRKQLDYVR